MATLEKAYKVTPNSPIMVTTSILAVDGDTISVDYVQNVAEGTDLTVNRMVVLRKEISGVEQYEKCLVATRSATSGAGNLVVARAQASTTAREWPVGTELAVVLTAEHINDLIDNQTAINDEVEDATEVIGTDEDTTAGTLWGEIYLVDGRIDALETDVETLTGGSSTDADSLHTHASLATEDFSGYTDKTTIVGADTVLINDSESTGAIKEVTRDIFVGTSETDLDAQYRTLIIQAAGCKIPGYGGDVATGSIARTGTISDADSADAVLTCTCTDHGLKTGEVIWLVLDTVGNAAYSGLEYAVTVSSSSEFTVTLASTPDPAISNDTGTFYVLGELNTMLFSVSAANSYIEAVTPMPENYDGGGMTAMFHIVPDADCSDSTNVIFGIQAKAVGSGDKLGAVYGSAVEVTTVVSSTDLIGEKLETAETASFTPANSPEGGDMLQFRIYREGTDTSAIESAVDFHLSHVRILYQTDAMGDGV